MRLSAIKANYRQVVFVVVAFLTMVVVSYSYVSDIVQRQLLASGNELLYIAESSVYSIMSEAEITTTNAAFAIDAMLSRGDTPDEILKYLYALTDWMHTKEMRFGGFSGIYGYIDETYLDGARWEPPPDYVPTERPWYVELLQADAALHYTAPYVDAQTGSVVTSVSTRLKDDRNRFRGVVAVDVDISAVAAYVRTLNAQAGGYGLLLDEHLKIVTHRDESLAGLPLGEIGEDYRTLSDLLAAGQDISATRFKDRGGVESVAFVRKIFNGWYIGAVTPVENYYNDMSEMAYVLSVLGGLLSLTLCFFLIRLYNEKVRSDEKNQSKSTFLAKMSHEIRTPMNAIVGMAELILRERGQISERAYEHTLAIKQASANLLSIINDILDFSKIESGKFEIVETPYLFASLLNDVVNIIGVRIKNSKAVFVVSLDGAMPNELFGDEVRIRQILLNLLSNAVKYTNEGHVALRIRWEDIDSELVRLICEVEDTGVGIREEDLPKLFAEFVQIDLATNKGVEGTGLGLAISRSYARAMNGDLSVRSVYGKGSVFTASIVQKKMSNAPVASVEEPEDRNVLIFEDRVLLAESAAQAVRGLGVACTVADTPDELFASAESEVYSHLFVASGLFERYRKEIAPSVSSADLVVMLDPGEVLVDANIKMISLPMHALLAANVLNDVPHPLRSCEDGEAVARFTAPSARVLLVDDIATNLRVAEGLIAPFGMQVDTCRSGQEAIDLIRAHRYDIVFMDHMMPGMDGIEATAIVRKTDGEYYQDLPIVALTANAIAGARKTFLRSGMDDFLAKPIETAKLFALLDRWIPESKKVRLGYAVSGGGECAPAIRIEGFDTQSGVQYAGGSADAYLAVLTVFYHEGAEKIRQIRNALDEEDIPLYTTYVHAVKSSSATVGAKSLSRGARALEAAGKRRDLAYLRAETERFLAEFDMTVARIGSALASRPEAPRPVGDLALLARNVESLGAALATYDASAAESLLAELGGYAWADDVEEALRAVSASLAAFEYDAASAALDKLAGAARA